MTITAAPSGHAATAQSPRPGSVPIEVVPAVVPPVAAGSAPLLVVTLATPAGSLAVVLTAQGVVRAAGFADPSVMIARLPDTLRARGVEVLGAAEASGRGPGPALVVDAVARYSAGQVAALDAVPVEQAGGPFQQRAWQAMRGIAPGGSATYAQLAEAAGSPAAVRAAGSACARNLIAPFVPCHRVLRTGGALGGYYYGLDVKRALLDHEAGAIGSEGAGASR